MLLLALLTLLAPAQELSRKECRDRFDAFYAEPARRCSPAADEAQTAKVAATQGRSEAWTAFYASCEEAHMEFLAVDRGCEDKFKEGYPNDDWRDRWAKLEAIDAAVRERLQVFGCARDRDPYLDKLTDCQGKSCLSVVDDAREWAGRCAPDALSEEAAGVGYRKSFELLGMLAEEAEARAEHAELVTHTGEQVTGGTADGLQLALASPWCTADGSWTCALDTSWRAKPTEVVADLRQFRIGEPERTALGRAQLTGVRDTRQRILKIRELRPEILDAPTPVVGTRLEPAPFDSRDPAKSVVGESPRVRAVWAEDDRLRAWAWRGDAMPSEPVTLDTEAGGRAVVSAVYGDQPYAVSFEIERSPADVATAAARVRKAMDADALRTVRRFPGAVELVYAITDDTEVTYAVFAEGRDAVVHRVVEHVGRAQARAKDRAKGAIEAALATGELADPAAFSERVAAFGDALDAEGLPAAIELHVGLLLATGDKAAFQRRLDQLAPQLDLWNERWRGTATEAVEEPPADPELIDPDVPVGPPTPRNRAPGTMALAIGGCAEAAWAEAAEAAHRDAKRWHREAVWAELELAVRDLRGEDSVDAARRYRFAMRQLAESVRLRNEAARLAGERDAFALKSGIERVGEAHPAFWLAAQLTAAECE